MKPKTKKQRLLNVIIALLVLFVAFVAVRFFGLSVPCPSHTLFGVNCTGCGATRMVVAFTKGDIYQAFRYNPALFIFFPFLAVYLGFEVFAYINGTANKLNGKFVKWVGIISIILLILFGILRNIPMFSFLAPTVV